MSGFLIRFLFVIIGLWFLRRVLGWLTGVGAQAPNREEPRFRTGANNGTVRDPVCGMYMDPRLALRVEDGKGPSYFCSAECKEKYLAGKEVGR